ncbi:ATP-binding protein [Halorientalis pallida]|uniref:histidine kinase n=1 Tax=Halorientalis pallida TaxID=2479928 RepID=A0A498KY61_9EURY|nr:PAS domain-containing sensor histidine kinase [Halorientalis pallida]RXK50530.1 PAS domain-containing sensor histidine kinase [Halorientalis pallida]
MSERLDENQRDEPRGGDDGGPRRLIEGLSTHAIFTLDPEGDIITWPGPAQALYGYDSSEMLGRTVAVLFADDTESDSVRGDLLQKAKNSSHEATAVQCRADGSEFWATLTLSPIYNDEFDGYAIVSHDTTTQRQETERLKRQNDRLKEFTDILVHDLRNPIQLIEARLSLYRETGEIAHLDTIADTTARMEVLVDDLLTVAKHGSAVADPDRIDMGEVIRTAWEATGKQSPEATLQTTELESVYADSNRLGQLFENLFQNALEHSGATVTVSVGPLNTGFYVEDDGPGISDELRKQVFNHGFSTSQDGSGYGLSSVRTIINAHGWGVTITEGDAGGARFEITDVDILNNQPEPES